MSFAMCAMRHWVMAWVNPNVLLQNYCWKDIFFKSKEVAFSKWEKKETNCAKWAPVGMWTRISWKWCHHYSTNFLRSFLIQAVVSQMPQDTDDTEQLIARPKRHQTNLQDGNVLPYLHGTSLKTAVPLLWRQTRQLETRHSYTSWKSAWSAWVLSYCTVLY